MQDDNLPDELERFKPETDAIRETMVGRETGSYEAIRTHEPFDERLSRVKTRAQQRGQTRRLGRAGCVASLLTIWATALGLAALASFLPPLADYNPVVENLEADDPYVRVTEDDYRLEQAGVTVEVLPSDPGVGFGVAVQRVTADQYRAGNVPDENWRCRSADTLPRYATLTESVFSLTTDGTAPARFGLSVPLPEAADAAQLDLYGWYPGTDGWVFVPAQTSAASDLLVTDLPVLPECLAIVQVAPPIPVVGMTLSPGQAFHPELASNVNRVYITGIQPTMQGTLQGVLPGGIQPNQGYALMPLIANYADPAVIDIRTVAAIMSSPEMRLQHSASIAAFAEANGYGGVALDYREIPVALRNQFSDFVKTLADTLHSKNRNLVVIVPPADFEESGWSTGAYDWRTLGQFADEIIIRAPLDPLAFLPAGEVETMLKWAVGEVNRYHLALGLSALSVEIAPNSLPNLIATTAVDELSSTTLLDPFHAETGTEAALQVQYVSYFDEDELIRTHWLTTPEALRYRLQQAQALNLGGIMIMDINMPGVDPTLGEALNLENNGDS